MLDTGSPYNDGMVLPTVIDDVRVPQSAGRPGRPRTRPEVVKADRAYPSRSNRECLRDRRITAVIPEEGGHHKRP